MSKYMTDPRPQRAKRRVGEVDLKRPEGKTPPKHQKRMESRCDLDFEEGRKQKWTGKL